jgi:heme-degrading monooxygenase HmoA
MRVRVTRFQFPAADVEKAVKQLNGALDRLSKKGLERVDILLDPKTGAAVTVAVWASEEAMKASEEEAEELRSELALELTGWIQGVERYDVIRSETY